MSIKSLTKNDSTVHRSAAIFVATGKEVKCCENEVESLRPCFDTSLCLMRLNHFAFVLILSYV